MAEDKQTKNILAVADEFREALLKKEKDAATRMVHAYGKIYARVFNELQALNQDIKQATLAGEEISAGWLARQKRYQSLITQLNAQLGKFRTDAGLAVTALQKNAMEQAQKAASEAAEVAGVSGEFHSLPTKAVENVAGFLGEGSPLNQLFSKLGAAASENVQKRLIEGVALGYGARKTANLIRQDLGGNLARALTIARTETLRAYRETTRQTLKENADITEGWYWRSARNSRCCAACIALDGTFHLADEPMKSHPNCIPAGAMIHAPEVQASTSRWYEGELVAFVTAGGNRLSVTPNHPILTARGWLPACLLQEGDDIVRARFPERVISAINPNNDNAPSRIEEIVGTFAEPLGVLPVSMPTSPEDFHGDGKGSQIHVVNVNGLLWGGLNSAGGEPILENDLSGGNPEHFSLPRPGAFDLLLEAMLAPSDGGMRGLSVAPVVFRCAAGHQQTIGGGLGSALDSALSQDAGNDIARDAQAIGDGLLRLPGSIAGANLDLGQGGELTGALFTTLGMRSVYAASDELLLQGLKVEPETAGGFMRAFPGNVSLDRVVKIDRVNFSGHVYNLQTSKGWYISNGIITHNCRCVQMWAFEGMAPEKGADWFEKQPEELKRKVIGTNIGFDLYKRGKLKPEDFVGLARHPVWGDSYHQLPVFRALKGEGRFPGDATKPLKFKLPEAPPVIDVPEIPALPASVVQLPDVPAKKFPKPKKPKAPKKPPEFVPIGEGFEFPEPPPPPPPKAPGWGPALFGMSEPPPPPAPPMVQPKKAPKPKQPKVFKVSTLPTLPVEELRKVDWHGKEETWQTDKPWNRRSYGGVIFDDDGRILLREPASHFDGYVWTFPKGKLDGEDEPPVDAAYREVLEETGHEGEVIGVLKGEHKGGTGSNFFFMMRSKGIKPGAMDKETQSTRWVTFEEAEELIKQTTNAVGQERDLGILAQAKSQYADLLKGKALDKYKPKKARAKKVKEVLPAVEEFIPDIPRKARDVSSFPDSADGLEVVKKLGGSTGAELVRDPATGRQYVRKRGASADHLREEFYADEAYAALGVPVPAGKLYETKGGPVKLAEFIEGRTLGSLSASERRVAEKQLRQHFAADALLGNWDAVGMNADNVLVATDGTAYRIDNGGSLRYRAQGAKKDADQWNAYPVELWTLRDKNVNAQMARMAAASSTAEEGRLNIFDLRRQIDAMATKRDDLLAALPQELRETVGARLKNLTDVARAAKDFEDDKWKADYTDEFGKHMIGLRKEGIVDRLPKKMELPSSSSYKPKDEDGREFDKLRGSGSIVNYLEAYMRKQGTKQSIVRDFVSAQGGSSWSPKAQAVKRYFAKQRGLDDNAYYWRDGIREADRNLESWLRAEPSGPTAINIYHAFHYEFFGKTEMPNNDREQKLLRLIRTESSSQIRDYGVRLGKGQKMTRGAHESASIFQAVGAVAGNETTVQNVPHHRATFSYLLGEAPDLNKTGFYRDGENEVMFLPEGIEFEYLGSSKKPKPEKGK